MTDREVRFDPGTCTVDAVQRALYRFTDRLSCDLTANTDSIVCALDIFGEEPSIADEVVHDFRSAVLDEVLRARIRTETEIARNLILSLAFSRTGLIEDDERA